MIDESLPEHLNPEFQAVIRIIDFAQQIHGKTHVELCLQGVKPIDSLIAGVYAAYQRAEQVHGDSVRAIEWMRDTIDTIERQLLGTKQ